MEYSETADLQDTAWADYRPDGDREVLARTHATSFRSTLTPSLACALTAARDSETVRAFSERLEQGLQLRLSSHPVPLNSFVGVIVLAKQ